MWQTWTKDILKSHPGLRESHQAPPVSFGDNGMKEASNKASDDPCFLFSFYYFCLRSEAESYSKSSWVLCWWPCFTKLWGQFHSNVLHFRDLEVLVGTNNWSQ